MTKKIVSAVMALLMLVALVGCTANVPANSPAPTAAAAAATDAPANTQAPAADTGTFRLGAFLQLTGGNSAYGIEARNATQLAVDYINSQGGFNGQQIELIVYDTQGSAEEAVKIATKLIETEKINACIGSVNSSEVLAAAGTFNDAGIITFGLGTSPTWMAKDWPFVFRATMNNGTAAPMTVNLIADCGLKSVAMFYGQDDASLATAKTFKEACTAKGIEVIAEETYDAGDTDYSAQVTKMNNSGAQCVYISVIGETGPVIVKQLRQYGYKGLIFNKESFMASQIEIAGKEAANYIPFANPYVTYNSAEECDIPLVKEFLVRYAEKYGAISKTDSAYRGWDSMMVLWEASKIAKSNKSVDLQAAVHKINALPGLGGTLDYSKGREGYGTFNSFILVDGKNVLFKQWLDNGGYEAYKKATGREF